MNDNFQRDYSELKTLHKETSDLLSKRKGLGKGDQSTVVLEQQIAKSLDKLKWNIETTTKGYMEKYKKAAANDQTEANKRINLLNDLEKIYKNLKSEYEQIIDQKYKYEFNQDKYNNYRDKEEFITLSHKDLVTRVNNETKKQDEDIHKLVFVAKEGNILAKDIGTDLSKQNVKLDKLNDDMIVVEGKMSKTQQKFEEFIDKSSYCCLYLIVILLIVGLALIIILV